MMLIALVALTAQMAACPPAKAQSAPSSRPQATAKPADGRQSSLDLMTPALQALQRDDSQNPAMLFVEDGAAQWRTPAGQAGKACVDCHGDASASMRGVAARYPAWSTAPGLPGGQPINLAGRVNACRTNHQQAKPWAADSPELLGMAAYIGLQSRGQPITPPDDARLAPLRAQGRALWGQRMGQLNLACTHCHDQRAGQRLGGAPIPQGHPTGYPIYRLEWQALGNLQRRLRGCLVGVRAEPYSADAPEWLALEAWLAQRAGGMAVETPAVRP